MSAVSWRDVACPRCKAVVRRPCVTAAGKVAQEPHAARRIVARAAAINASRIPVPTHATLAAFGQQLRARREQAGLRQQDVAAQVGIHYQQVGNIERGESAPRLTTLLALAGGLGLQVVLVDPDATDDTLRARIAELEAEAERQREALSWRSLRILRRRAEEGDAAVGELGRARQRVADLERQLVDTEAALSRNNRAAAALDALARHETLSHELLERARTAAGLNVAGKRVAA